MSVAAAARRLGVAPATLRTWDRRYGIGPSNHTPGRHRRYSAEDLVRLELMQHALIRGAGPAEAARHALAARLPRSDGSEPDRPWSVDPDLGPDLDGRDRDAPGPAGECGPAGESGPVGESGQVGVEGRGAVRRPAARRERPSRAARADGSGSEVGDPLLTDADGPGETGSRVRVGGSVLRLPGAGRRARGLGRAALSLDSTAIAVLLADAIAADGVEKTWEEVARPVLVAVGARWASTGAGVEIEHLMSQCVAAVFSAHATRLSSEVGRPVVLAGMPGERHLLPLVVLGAALADRGVPARQLGPDLPVEALVATLRRTAPAAVIMWSQLSSTADGDFLRALPRTRPRARLFVAGPGWADVPLPVTVGRLSALGSAVDVVAAAAV